MVRKKNPKSAKVAEDNDSRGEVEETTCSELHSEEVIVNVAPSVALVKFETANGDYSSDLLNFSKQDISSGRPIEIWNAYRVRGLIICQVCKTFYLPGLQTLSRRKSPVLSGFHRFAQF